MAEYTNLKIEEELLDFLRGGIHLTVPNERSNQDMVKTMIRRRFDVEVLVHSVDTFPNRDTFPTVEDFRMSNQCARNVKEELEDYCNNCVLDFLERPRI